MSKLIFLIFFLIISSLTVNATSISPVGYRIDQLTQAGEYYFEFKTGSTNDMIYELRGNEEDLNQVKIVESSANSVTVYVNATEYLTPGMHKIWVRAEDDIKTRGFVVAKTAVMASIEILGPYNQKYLEGGLDIRSKEPFDPIYIDLNVKSIGLIPISSAKAELKIFDPKTQTVIKKIQGKEIISLEPAESHSWNLDWLNPELEGGFYPVEAKVTYDDLTLIITDTLKIGKLDFEVLNSTPTILANSISPIDLWTQSYWLNPVEFDMDIRIVDNQGRFTDWSQSKTETFQAYEKKRSKIFLNAKNFHPGNYTLEIKARFGELHKNYTFPIQLIKEIQPLKEEPKSSLSKLILNTNFLLIIIITLLIIMILKRRHKNEEE